MDILTEHGVMMIQNDIDTGGISKTNYFYSDIAKSGYLFLSIFGDCLRLLIPERLKDIKYEIGTADHIVVTKGKMDGFSLDCIEIMFEDNSDRPLCVYINEYATDFKMDKSYLNKELSFKIYYSISDIFEYRAYFRCSPLPCRQKYRTLSIN